MSTVADHYQNLLAPIYLWMAGGLEAALSRGESEIEALSLNLPENATAVDLGAGFGMHAIPLARRGCAVIAVDGSHQLLGVLQENLGALPIQAVEDDLLAFQTHMKGKAHLILCMGDTLTHLSDPESVEGLFSRVAESLHAGGRFILTFRDYTTPLLGERRFIPVRSDPDRILVCFLDYSPGCVVVHDLLHERNGSNWEFHASSYRKLRISPEWVSTALQDEGFSVHLEPGPAGMVRVVAQCPAPGSTGPG
jgi:SAM-dependent methyltransferase